MPDDFQIKAAIVTELVPPVVLSEDDSPSVKIPVYQHVKCASNDPFSAKLRGERTWRIGRQNCEMALEYSRRSQARFKIDLDENGHVTNVQVSSESEVESVADTQSPDGDYPGPP